VRESEYSNMATLPIRGVYEVAIRVKNLARSEGFYRELLGLTVGLRDESRKWLFLRAGDEAGMIVLQEDESNWPTQHFAFAIREEDINLACEQLREVDIPFEGPVLHEWMPAKSIYFSDPDGHDLELCAPLGDGSKS
jgi:catechol 2,3-dioxygenase-like lactoylglutathione lyase family enzyme